jgi:hypothetical protein
MKITLRPRYSAGYNDFVERVNVDVAEVSVYEAPLAVLSEQGITRWYKGRHFKRYDLPNSVSLTQDGEELMTPIEEVIACLDQDAWHHFKGHTMNGVPCSSSLADTN